MSGEEVTVVLEREEGEPIGAQPNEQLMVTRVQKGTAADGHLQLGDVIVAVNGRNVKTVEEFYRLLRQAYPTARLLVRRGTEAAATLRAGQLPAELERLLQRKAGYAYSMATVEWRAGGPRLGLGIKHSGNRVLVSRLEDGSVAGRALRCGDRIYAVDGLPVSDKEVAKQLVVDALQSRGATSLVVERPESPAALLEIKTALAASDARAPSVDMPSDVQQIAREQRERMKSAAPTPKPILTQPGGGGSGRRITVNPQHETVPIRSDTDPNKQLRSVPRA